MEEEKQLYPGYDNVYAALTYQGKRVELRISYYAVCLASPVWKKVLSLPRLLVDNKDQSGDNNSKEISTENAVKSEPPEEPSNLYDTHTLDEFELMGSGFGHSKLQDSPLSANRTILDLTDDDADSVLLILRIAHLQFHNVPMEKLKYRKLLKLAILLDYYDCVELVKPWSSWWLLDGMTESKIPGQEGWLTIAWVFDDAEIFNALAYRLVLKVSPESKYQCYTQEGKQLALKLPVGIVDRIISLRRIFIQELLERTYARVNKYVISATEEEAVYSFDERHSGYGNSYWEEKKGKECDAMAYGSLLMALRSHELWPPKDEEDITMSINSLVSELESLKTFTYNSPNGDQHADCGMGGYKKEIANLVATFSGPHLSSCRRVPQTRK